MSEDVFADLISPMRVKKVVASTTSAVPRSRSSSKSSPVYTDDMTKDAYISNFLMQSGLTTNAVTPYTLNGGITVTTSNTTGNSYSYNAANLLSTK